MDWALILVALGALSTVAWAASPLLCRLGVHARPHHSTSARWVCRRCPAMHDAELRTIPEVDDEG